MMKRTGLEALILFCICLIAVLGVATSYINEEVFLKNVVVEDGPVEWLTVVALLCCAALAMTRLVQGKQAGRNATYLLGLLLGTGVFLFGAGEEISWGQRIFQVESPEFFVKHNAQQETNLHNLVVGETGINKLVFGKILGVGILSFLFLLPWLWERSAKIQSLAAQWAVPVPRWKQSLTYLGLIAMCSMVVAGKRGELLEFCGCWMFFLILLNPVNASIYQTSKSSEEVEPPEVAESLAA